MIVVASVMKRTSPSARSALLGPREVDAKIVWVTPESVGAT
jgi:hypothetical protein